MTDQPSEPLLSPACIHLSNLTLTSILSKPGRRRPALPLELILQILSYPPCWILTDHLQLERPVRVSSRRSPEVLLRTQPFSQKQLSSLRKIIFTFCSRDQGWSSYTSDYGTYENSWTWFTMAIVKEKPPSSESERDTKDHTQHPTTHPSPPEIENTASELNTSSHVEQHHHLQRNRHASLTEETYRIEIEAGDERLRSLDVGDVLELLACAQFGGWENRVKEASMEIWAVDDVGDVVLQ